MTLTEMEAAISQAKSELRRCDMIADQLAELLCGRLRKINTRFAKRLKAELRGFNAHTETWK